MTTILAIWINVNPTSGVDNGNNNSSVSANSSLTSRSEIITYQGGNKTKKISINQTGLDTSLTISTAHLIFTNIGGINNFEVYSYVAYSLTAGTGNSSLLITTKPNVDVSPRSSELILNDGIHSETVIINQDGLFNSLTEPGFMRLKVFPTPSSGQIFINATKLK
jgi:hypothetical protein